MRFSDLVIAIHKLSRLNIGGMYKKSNRKAHNKLYLMKFSGIHFQFQHTKGQLDFFMIKR